MSDKILDASKLVTKQEVVNWFIRELAKNTCLAVSSYAMKEDPIFIHHMADLLLEKIAGIVDKNFEGVLEDMADIANESEDTEAEHDFWGVAMSLENDISSFKHYKMKGLDRVIDIILDQQAKKRRGTVIKMEINKATAN
jgi:hypothetical protein